MRTFLLIIATLVSLAGDAAGNPSGDLRDLPLAARFAISSTLGRETADYHAVATKDGNFTAANPAQRYATLVTDRGFTVTAGTERWGLQLEAWGCGETIEPLPAATPRARANRVELVRGSVTEWYENGPLGLQQGFTLEQPPRDCGANEPVRLLLASIGNDALTIAGDGKSLAIGSAFHYGELAAFDAAGREIPSRMDLQHGRVVLEVAAGATYPLIVDPFVQLAKLTAAAGTRNSLFGHVAVSGNTVVVGESFTTKGTVYVFVEPPGGWSGARTETAKLVASDAAAGDSFGFAVGISGDTVVVGAGRKDIGTQSQRGAAYVFVKPSGGWSGTLTEQAKLLASDGAARRAFGLGAAIERDTIVVGQIGDNEGALYVFLKPGGGWTGTLTQTAKLVRSDAPAGSFHDRFGTSVAISGDTVVAGAHHKTIGTTQYQGAAYVFVKPGGGWLGRLTQNARLVASDGAYGQTLGYASGVFRDTVVVAANGDNRGQGAVYEYRKPAGGWAGTLTENAKIVAADGAAADQFGESLAFADGTLVVAAPYDDIGANVDQGSAYVFRLCCACPL